MHCGTKHPLASYQDLLVSRSLRSSRISMFTLRVNGNEYPVDVAVDVPLLWVLRDVIGLTGTKFGCGIAQCGACTVHIDSRAVRSCVLPAASVAGKNITTIEGIGNSKEGASLQKA